MAHDYEVLLTYPGPEAGLAKRFVELLQQQGVSVWWNRGRPSDSARGTVSGTVLHLMEPLLVRAKYLVVIATGTALASDWVPFELASFLENKSPVIVWYPQDDGSNLLPFRHDTDVHTFQKPPKLVEHKDIFAHYDFPRGDVDLVAAEVALLVRFFSFVESKGEKVSKDSRSRHWDEFWSRSSTE